MSDMPVLEVVVIDADSGRPVSFGVMVCADGYCAPTGPDGIARLNVPIGTYTLTVGGGAYEIRKYRVTADRDKRIRVTIRRILL